jgi:glycosyltransferase A (GT-A) superfamily protein (DUF2064 family)
MNNKPKLLVFARRPALGQGKTRLAKNIGVLRTHLFYKQNLYEISFCKIGDPRWETVFALTEKDVPSPFPTIPAQWQGKGNLGERMAKVLKYQYAGNPPVIIIGSDIPGIQRQHIQAGFRSLQSCDAVFGPSPDGGFWLIGLARRKPVPLHFMKTARWSTEHALADVLHGLKGLHIAPMLPELNDIDTVEDFERWKRADS